MTTFFISGHGVISARDFNTNYVDKIIEAASAGHSFVVGDFKGVDLAAQRLLHNMNYRNVVVYHMLDSPRHNYGGFDTIGGFESDEERDAAMTAASDEDIAWFAPGREDSCTARNIARREESTSG